ncbi:MAG: hypothetical protein DMF65_13340 [Acidobacteria bacterium]|nr:MAG: hypothetical protein DMF65_13340 [Acidobacteriota bacterium]
MSAISYTDDLIFSINMAESPAQVCEAVAGMTDHRLLEATRTGDEAAFAELVRRYRNQITNYVYRMTNDYDLAVDLAQETFMRVYAAADRYRTSFAFSTYIYRIATNLAISELRRRKRRRLVLQDATYVEDERRAAVARAIATLPEKYRAPLVLRDVEERSYEEIALILQMNEGTVKSRINRARTFLRDKLQAYL